MCICTCIKERLYMCSEEVFLWVFILLFYHYFLCSFVYILFIYTSS